MLTMATKTKARSVERIPRPKIDKETAKKMFYDLEQLTTIEVARKYGFEESYTDDKTKLRFLIHNEYKNILSKPEEYGIDTTDAERIRNIVSMRSQKVNPQQLPVEVRQYVENFENTLEGVRNEAMSILKRKLERLKTNKDLEDISFRDIKDIVAMTIDKTRLLSGESTENVVQFSKIDPNLSPQDALKLLLKAREAAIEQKK